MVGSPHKHHPSWPRLGPPTPKDCCSSEWEKILDLAQTTALGGPQAVSSGPVGEDVMFLKVSKSNTVC